MTNLEMKVQKLERDMQFLRLLLAKKSGLGSNDIKANIVQPSDIAATIAADSVTQTMIAANAIGQSELKYEVATLIFGSGDTVKTATVTASSIVIGVYESSVTSTPATGELQLVISSITLTGTRSASPGGAAAITYTVILLKA